MARFLKVWSGMFAAIFLIGETLSNLAVGGKPVSILLPYYVISALLIVGILLRRYRLKWLLLGWGLAFGYSYVAFADSLAIFLGDDRLPEIAAIADKLNTSEEFVRPPVFLLVGLGVFLAATLVGLGSAYYCCRADARQSGVTDGFRAHRIRFLVFLSGLFAVSVAAGQLLTTWGLARPLTVLAAYYLNAGCLLAAVFLHRSKPKMFLSTWSVALGFFYAELTAFLIFFERPAWVVNVAVTATVVSLLGSLLAFGALHLDSENDKGCASG